MRAFVLNFISSSRTRRSFEIRLYQSLSYWGAHPIPSPSSSSIKELSQLIASLTNTQGSLCCWAEMHSGYNVATDANHLCRYQTSWLFLVRKCNQSHQDFVPQNKTSGMQIFQHASNISSSTDAKGYGVHLNKMLEVHNKLTRMRHGTVSISVWISWK